MRNELRLLSLLVVSAGLLAGCRSTRVSGLESSPVRVDHHLESDSALERAISLLDPRFEEHGGRRSAVFALRLESGPARDVWIHLDWYDARDQSTRSLPEEWIPVHLVHGTPRVVRVEAPMADARSFRLRIQRSEAVR